MLGFDSDVTISFVSSQTGGRGAGCGARGRGDLSPRHNTYKKELQMKCVSSAHTPQQAQVHRTRWRHISIKQLLFVHKSYVTSYRKIREAELGARGAVPAAGAAPCNATHAHRPASSRNNAH
ncbi:hypothetical protein RR46_08775 [Papilio xuthus]|uniref:Uncharacterized protein n=1 Tax=Papilio xuthus TaxID=66420 RepID=A0A194PPE7_PAPXU|nr:hypothetical protein RR46_08775 [Papilio xuthus]